MLANKVVMITGVGSGLGRALSAAFAAEGSRVIGIARREESLRETAALIESDAFSGHVADVASFDEIAAVVARYERIDIAFNNAAVYPRISFLDESSADWARAIDVNVNGVANVCKALLPGMIANGYGRIYNVGSFADVAPIADSAAYSASKGAVRALTKAIAADLRGGDADIEVHEWVPGHLKTQMSGFTGIEPEVAAAWGVQLAAVEHARTPNCIFENDREWLPPKGLKQRVLDKLRALLRFGRDGPVR
ncbi:MAG: SDR family NAD(P)-dependent oxidoreductase [Gammaproteobacteria bacterium]|nr:SDR family oxidoreductase [Gammaproteobacteria bacterium]NND55143.1 SDR family NAD(P)-dependent oxidoreductase [Gammaproteobacteria bacterium]